LKKIDRKRKFTDQDLVTPTHKIQPTVINAKRKGAKSVSGKKYIREVEYDGDTFKVGDSAYVVLNPGEFDWSAEEREVCAVCGCDDDETVIECDRCLLGYHLSCLHPPLKAVPMVSLSPLETRD
jgi:hypothetical protein